MAKLLIGVAATLLGTAVILLGWRLSDPSSGGNWWLALWPVGALIAASGVIRIYERWKKL